MHYLFNSESMPPEEQAAVRERIAAAHAAKVAAEDARILAMIATSDAIGRALASPGVDFEPEARPLAEVVPERPVRIRGRKHWHCPLHGWTTAEKFYVPIWSLEEPWSCVECANVARAAMKDARPKVEGLRLSWVTTAQRRPQLEASAR